MKIINREMGGGKTTALVEMMLRPGNEDVIYVAPTFAQAEYARQMALKMTVDSPDLKGRFLNAGALQNRNGREERYVIDEFDGVIGGLVGGEVIAVAGTDEDVRNKQRTRQVEGANVKSDSKGRLTGATPGGNYVKKTLPDGTITFTPTEAEVTPDKGSTHLIYSTNLKNGNPRITIEMPNLKDQRQVARVIQAVSQELPLDEVWMEGTGVKAVAYETLRKRLVTGKMVQFYPSAKGFTEFRE